MNIFKNISTINIKSNNLSQKDTFILSIRNYFDTLNNNLKEYLNINPFLRSPKEPHVRPYLFPYMWNVKHTHGVSGCRNWAVRKTTTATTDNNNDSNNDDNCNRNMNDNCNYIHNNRYKRYTKHISHISTYTYRDSSNPTYVGIISESARVPLRMCLLVSLIITTVSCNNTNYIYRVEYNDGTVEYFNIPPERSAEPVVNVKNTVKIKADEITKYENK